MSECLVGLCLVKNGSNVYLGDDGVKELVRICDHVHSPIRRNRVKTASYLLKGQDSAENPCDADTGNDCLVGLPGSLTVSGLNKHTNSGPEDKNSAAKN